MMSGPIRVLVVDDSALMRTVISRLLREAGMEVVATARNGEDALAKAKKYHPDVITLDIEMPGMDGLTVLKRLLPEMPIPVVMVSSLTQENAPATIEALSLGAVDVVGKPGGSVVLDLREVEEELVRKVRVAAGARLRPLRPRPEPREGGSGMPAAAQAPGKAPDAAPSSPPPAASPLTAPSPAAPPARVRERRPLRNAAIAATETAAAGTADAPPAAEHRREEKRSSSIVVVAVSTGGPGALAEMIPELPADLPAPVVVVQHMPPGFTASLAGRLDRMSALRVAEAVEGLIPQPGEVWVARGGLHLVFDDEGRMRFSDAPPHLNVRPAADLTLESAAAVWGAGVVAVVMTGMGMDGTRGASRVRKAGGCVIAQDEETSVVYGMPRAVTELGIAHRVCPLPELAAAISEALAEREDDRLARAGV